MIISIYVICLFGSDCLFFDTLHESEERLFFYLDSTPYELPVVATATIPGSVRGQWSKTVKNLNGKLNFSAPTKNTEFSNLSFKGKIMMFCRRSLHPT